MDSARDEAPNSKNLDGLILGYRRGHDGVRLYPILIACGSSVVWEAPIYI
jgi:hypothetical protein